MTENNKMTIYDDLRTVPKEAQKPINAGRLKGMTNISPQWRIKRLTEVFGACGIGWKVEITDKRIETGADGEKVAIVDVNLYIKDGEKWSDPIPGTGGSMLIANERGGAHSSDEAYKMAFTDALSVAGKMLGLAGDIYFQSEPTKYDASKDGDLSFHSIAAVKKRMEQRVTAIMQKGRSLEEVAKLCDPKLNAKTLSQIIGYADKLAYVESRLNAID